MSIRILGLDISSSITGWGLLSSSPTTYISSGIIRLTKFKSNHPEKMLYLYNNLDQLLPSLNISVVILEDPIFYVGRFSSAKSVAICHYYWAIARVVLAKHKIPTIQQHPSTTKALLSIKRSDKDKVGVHNAVHTNLPKTINITQKDELDAIGLALSHIYYLNSLIN